MHGLPLGPETQQQWFIHQARALAGRVQVWAQSGGVLGRPLSVRRRSMFQTDALIVSLRRLGKSL